MSIKIESKPAKLDSETADRINSIVSQSLRGHYEGKPSSFANSQNDLNSLTRDFETAHNALINTISERDKAISPYQEMFTQARIQLTLAERKLQDQQLVISKERDFDTAGKWQDVFGRVRVLWGNRDFHPPFYLRFLKRFGTSYHPALFPYLKMHSQAQGEVRQAEEMLNQATTEAGNSWSLTIKIAQEVLIVTQNRLIKLWENEVTTSLSSVIDYVRILPERASAVALKFAKEHAHEKTELRFFAEFASILHTQVGVAQVKRLLGNYLSSGQIDEDQYQKLPNATKHQWEEFLAEKLVKEWVEVGIIH